MYKSTIEIETDHLKIRTTTEADKESYMGLRCNASNIAPAYALFEELSDEEWKDMNDDPDNSNMNLIHAISVLTDHQISLLENWQIYLKKADA